MITATLLPVLFVFLATVISDAIFNVTTSHKAVLFCSSRIIDALGHTLTPLDMSWTP